MGEVTAISWTDHTWNPWIGCTKVSPACDGCYAEALMDTRHHRVAWGGPGKGVGTRSRTSPATWREPFRWARKAKKDGTRPLVFCASLADIFDNAVPAEWRLQAFEVMRATPELVYLLLTKRPQLIVKLAAEAGGLPANAAIGTTVEDQPSAINLFHLAVAARTTKPLFIFASLEPLLGPVDPRWITVPDGIAKAAGTVNLTYFNAFEGVDKLGLPRLGWAITGGETDQGKHKARPTSPDWFRSLRDQCATAGVPFHFKQWGEHRPLTAAEQKQACGATLVGSDRHAPDAYVLRVGKTAAGRLLDGVEHNARPVLP